ncbi:MAG: hypothetical protein EOO43_23395 [Flavobacterium sp.]|nr:MAG: hypothetical protein EOO43_23395 [Flavobacterium sp.]
MPGPRLFIVAGPNGSGKSLFSKILTDSDFEVFDGDKHMTSLVKQFPETGSQALWSHIDENIFKEEKDTAIRLRLNYAFETNFSSSNPMASVRQFKDAGYEVHMIYMGLNSLEESIQRVENRVRLGGHKVAEVSIRYNYEHGFKNLYKHFLEFDSITLYDNSISSSPEPKIPREILYIMENKLHLNINTYPEWTRPIIESFR